MQPIEPLKPGLWIHKQPNTESKSMLELDALSVYYTEPPQLQNEDVTRDGQSVRGVYTRIPKLKKVSRNIGRYNQLCSENEELLLLE